MDVIQWGTNKFPSPIFTVPLNSGIGLISIHWIPPAGWPWLGDGAEMDVELISGSLASGISEPMMEILLVSMHKETVISPLNGAPPLGKNTDSLKHHQRWQSTFRASLTSGLVWLSPSALSQGSLWLWLVSVAGVCQAWVGRLTLTLPVSWDALFPWWGPGRETFLMASVDVDSGKCSKEGLVQLFSFGEAESQWRELPSCENPKVMTQLVSEPPGLALLLWSYLKKNTEWEGYPTAHNTQTYLSRERRKKLAVNKPSVLAWAIFPHQEQTVLKNLSFSFHFAFHCSLDRMLFFPPFSLAGPSPSL